MEATITLGTQLQEYLLEENRKTIKLHYFLYGIESNLDTRNFIDTISLPW